MSDAVNSMFQGIQGMLDPIVALRDQYLSIIECLDEVYSGFREHSVVVYQEHPPVVLPAMIDLANTLPGAPQASFDAP